MSLFPTVGKPGVEVTAWPGREIHQQLHEVEMRVHVMPAAAAGQVGQDRRSHAAYTKGNFDRLGRRILCFGANLKESECCDEW